MSSPAGSLPAGVLALLLAATPLAAQAPAEPPPALDWELSYTAEYAHNLTGGARTGGGLQGLLETAVTLDTEAAGWWSGGAFFIGGAHLHGGDPTTNRAGVFQTATDIEGQTTTRLNYLGYDHDFADTGASLRLGMYDLSDEFTVADGAESFLNSSFGFQPDLGLNLDLSTYPIATLGLRLAWESEHVDLRAAAFDGKPCSVDHSAHGTCLHFSADDGVFLIGEAAWRPAGAAQGGAEWKLGAWHHSDEFRDFEARAGAPRTDGNEGFYGNGSFLLAGDADGSGLDAFFKAGWAPPDRNPVTLFTGGGLVWRGPFAARPADRLGLAFSRVNFSHPWRQRSGVAAHETVIECSYSADLGGGFTLRPDLQWIRHPAVAPGLDDAWLAVLRVEIAF